MTPHDDFSWSGSQNSEFLQLQGYRSSFSDCPSYSSIQSTVFIVFKTLFLIVAINLYVVTEMFSWS